MHLKTLLNQKITYKLNDLMRELHDQDYEKFICLADLIVYEKSPLTRLLIVLFLR